MKIWTITTDHEGSQTAVHMTAEAANAQAVEIVAAWYDRHICTDGESRDHTDWRESYSILCDSVGFMDTISLEEHDISDHPAIVSTHAAKPMEYNCLCEGETIASTIARDYITGFDLRFCRSIAIDPDDRDTITCDADEAEFACIYGITDIGEAIAIHDAQLTSAGADEIAACCREMFVAIVNRFAHSPDAAQRHEAEQEAICAATARTIE